MTHTHDEFYIDLCISENDAEKTIWSEFGRYFVPYTLLHVKSRMELRSHFKTITELRFRVCERLYSWAMWEYGIGLALGGVYTRQKGKNMCYALADQLVCSLITTLRLREQETQMKLQVYSILSKSLPECIIHKIIDPFIEKKVALNKNPWFSIDFGEQGNIAITVSNCRIQFNNLPEAYSYIVSI